MKPQNTYNIAFLRKIKDKTTNIKSIEELTLNFPNKPTKETLTDREKKRDFLHGIRLCKPLVF